MEIGLFLSEVRELNRRYVQLCRSASHKQLAELRMRLDVEPSALLAIRELDEEGLSRLLGSSCCLLRSGLTSNDIDVAMKLAGDPAARRAAATGPVDPFLHDIRALNQSYLALCMRSQPELALGVLRLKIDKDILLRVWALTLTEAGQLLARSTCLVRLDVDERSIQQAVKLQASERDAFLAASSARAIPEEVA